MRRTLSVLSVTLLFSGCVSTNKASDNQRTPASDCDRGVAPKANQYIYSMNLDGLIIIAPT